MLFVEVLGLFNVIKEEKIACLRYHLLLQKTDDKNYGLHQTWSTCVVSIWRICSTEVKYIYVNVHDITKLKVKSWLIKQLCDLSFFWK